MKYPGPDLVITEGNVPLEVYNICCDDMLVCHRDGGPREYVKLAGQLCLLFQPVRVGDIISEQLRGLSIRTRIYDLFGTES